MKNFYVKIAFDGTDYGGWQLQKNSYTVQQAVEEALETVLLHPCRITGCGRTDAGVHASGYIFSFRTDVNIPPQGLLKALCARLPSTISPLEVREAGADFSAQFSAVAKQYVYRFNDSGFRNPFTERYSLFIDHPLDVELMNSAAKHFLGHHDFHAFCAAGAQNVTFDRVIYRSEVLREDGEVRYYVCGNGFLYNMVRIIAGTLLYVSEGKIKADSVPDIITLHDRELAGKTLPPRGLTLDTVYYDNTHLRASTEEK